MAQPPSLGAAVALATLVATLGVASASALGNAPGDRAPGGAPGSRALGRGSRAAAGHDTCCTLCGGSATYPVGGPGTTSFYSTQTVPGLPLNTSAFEVATYFIYFNIFFDNYVPAGRGVYNQFVPQMMLGNPLSGSTGPPIWDPTWSMNPTWIFGAQYFMELNNSTNSTPNIVPKAATGATYPCYEGETIFTRFSLSEGYAGPAWLLEMGVVGDASRYSSVVAPQPFMGLLGDVTQSWSEPIYDHVHVNGCWELYGVDTPHAFPSTGSDVQWTTMTRAPGSIDWFRNWTNIEVPTCAGAPTATFSDAVSPTWQQVVWNISAAAAAAALR